MAGARILVIEDEPNLRQLLVRLLGTAGYLPMPAATGTQGIRLALDEEFDLVILDLMLPDISGEQVQRVLLAHRPQTPILVLSSVPEVHRRVGVLEGGAVDFLAKPFVNSELLARVRLRLRATGVVVPAVSTRLSPDGELDLARREIVRSGRRIPLSQREFALLNYFVDRRGAVCTRQELLADVWGLSFDPGTNVVDVYVRRLRNKLSAESIETVRNVGYRLIAC